eukprot:UN0758
MKPIKRTKHFECGTDSKKDKNEYMDNVEDQALRAWHQLQEGKEVPLILMRGIRDWIYDMTTSFLEDGEVLPMSYLLDCMGQAIREAVGEWASLKLFELDGDDVVAVLAMDGEWLAVEGESSDYDNSAGELSESDGP